MSKRKALLLVIVAILQFSSIAMGDDSCDIKKKHPVKIVIRSKRSRSGTWDGMVNITRSYASDGGTNPVRVDLQRNMTNCNENAGVSVVADIVVSPVPPSSAEDEPQLYRFENVGSYIYHSRPAVWHDAKQTCEIEFARLAIINSETEARELATILRNHSKTDDPSSNQAYLGASDVATEGFFITVEGEPLSRSAYVAWRQGAPGARLLEGDCVTLGPDGKMATVGCTTKLPFLCEQEQPTQHSNSALHPHDHGDD